MKKIIRTYRPCRVDFEYLKIGCEMWRANNNAQYNLFNYNIYVYIYMASAFHLIHLGQTDTYVVLRQQVKCNSINGHGNRKLIKPNRNPARRTWHECLTSVLPLLNSRFQFQFLFLFDVPRRSYCYTQSQSHTHTHTHYHFPHPHPHPFPVGFISGLVWSAWSRKVKPENMKTWNRHQNSSVSALGRFRKCGNVGQPASQPVRQSASPPVHQSASQATKPQPNRHPSAHCPWPMPPTFHSTQSKSIQWRKSIDYCRGICHRPAATTLTQNPTANTNSWQHKNKKTKKKLELKVSIWGYPMNTSLSWSTCLMLRSVLYIFPESNHIF